VFFDESVSSLAAQNPHYGPVPEVMSAVRHAAFTGDKGENPVCLMSKKTSLHVMDDDPRDLSLIYRLVERLSK
jgi:hypothetical protein